MLSYSTNMSIDVEPRDLGKVVQLVAKNDGWTREEIRYHVDRTTYIGGDTNPKVGINRSHPSLVEPLSKAWLTTRQMRPKDYNGSKVAIIRFAVFDVILGIEGVVTDYFTLWGLPKAEATKKLFEDHKRVVVINRMDPPDVYYGTDLPWGASSHNILLDRNGDILMMLRSPSQGFSAGLVTATGQEQTEVADSSIFSTAARGFKEELGLSVPQSRMRLLGVAMEKEVAYSAFAFITETNILASELVNKWKRARDYHEHIALFAVPMTEIYKWIMPDYLNPNGEIYFGTWSEHLLAGDISQDVILKLYPTSTWRMGLAREYASLAK